VDWTGIIGGIVGGIIGVAGGVSATVLSNRNARRMALDAARREAYMRLVKAIYGGLIPASRYLQTGEGPGDLEPITRARSYVVFGSPTMVRLYGNLYGKCAAWAAQAQSVDRGAEAFAEVSEAALRLEHRIHVEMQPQPSRWQRARSSWNKKS
jgi:hypothetical protein